MGNTMLAADLHRILSDAKQFRCNDSNIRTAVPMLGCVRLESDGTNIIAVATDRYTLGVSRADFAGETFAANLDKQAVDNLLRFTKTARAASGNRTVSIEILTRFNEQQANTINIAFSTGEALFLVCDTSDFPKWRALIPVGWGSELVENVSGFNPVNLAKFAKIASKSDTRMFSRGPNKPLVVTVGDDFIALVMHTRVDSGVQYIKPSWISN